MAIDIDVTVWDTGAMTTTTAPASGTLTIRSSDGVGAYTVRVHDRVPVACTCTGWRYRGRCRHLQVASAAVSAGVVPTAAAASGRAR